MRSGSNALSDRSEKVTNGPRKEPLLPRPEVLEFVQIQGARRRRPDNARLLCGQIQMISKHGEACTLRAGLSSSSLMVLSMREIHSRLRQVSLLMTWGKLMKIKNYIWLVLVLGLINIPAEAQRRRPPTTRDTRDIQLSRATQLTASQRVSALDARLSTTCSEAAMAPKALRTLAHNPQVFSPDRLARTLNGVWIGRVIGEYDPQLLAKDGSLNTDYYMIVDMKRGEAFTYQEFTDRRSGAGMRAKRGAPVWSYTWCARENYESKSPRQVHTFTKVSDNIDDAREILSKSVGLRFGREDRVVLSDLWKKLVEAKFFDNPRRSLAYAGVLFKPVTLGSVGTAARGGSLLELRMVGEYRGAGETAAKFELGVPIHNVEQAQFLGVAGSARLPQGALLASDSSIGSGDYITAAAELGNAMFGPKADFNAAVFSTQMAFDKVVIGPLDSGRSASLRKPRK